jgi:hypothetical protein
MRKPFFSMRETISPATRLDTTPGLSMVKVLSIATVLLLKMTVLCP